MVLHRPVELAAVTGNSGEAATKICIQMTPLAPAAMKWRKGLRAGLGIALCVVGFVLARFTAYRETSVIIRAAGCPLVTDVIDRGDDDVRGYVVLLHGLSANKKIMAYLARGFAAQNLRVFVPDLPGHGHTPGPFSFEQAETCAEALVRELSMRGAIDPRRTMLAGHSMGGAIAIRVAARAGVAGVIAISPAPMRAAHGVAPDMLPYTNPPPVPAHTLAISAAFEPLGIREITRDLITEDGGATSKYLFVPRATHVSVLYDPRVVHASQEWSAETLKFPAEFNTPSAAPLFGGLAGLVGILLLAGPFVRETLGMPNQGLRSASETPRPYPTEARLELLPMPVFRVLMEVSAVFFVTVALLRLWNPLSFVQLFNGGYFASFLLIAGVAISLIHRKSLRASWPAEVKAVLFAAFAAFALHLLVTAWFEATLAEAWLSWARWARFPVLFVAAFAYLFGEELLLGPVAARGMVARIRLALAVRAIAFIALVFGIFVLHSGAILEILLALYLALFFLFQRMGMDIVRQETGSPIAAALFGAILLAGFCLVIFPVT
jgi:pimeloyl-ACP methyl ester carboxylesterase